MPLGFERLNERTQRPNPLINFIKPLPGTSSATAHDYLSRIAAIVYPIMKANHIAVMSLEEFPSNREFWGRNFNAGEVVQLVLQDARGGWLPFRQVQMVMVHELAHCKQMNHSKFFWGVRNAYAEELKTLWGKKYTGEGLWGAGRGLADGAFMQGQMPDAEYVPEHLCGGVYRNRGKRKRGGRGKKPELSYAERKQRRILKKFGAGGTSLGADEGERMALENGRLNVTKPRVASSKRGRELRAAAALARFDQMKKEPEVKREDSGSDSELSWSESDNEGERDVIKTEGKDLIRVCGDEDGNDENVKREQQEMLDFADIPSLENAGQSPSSSKPPRTTHAQSKAVAGAAKTKEVPPQKLTSKTIIEPPKPKPQKNVGTSSQTSSRPAGDAIPPVDRAPASAIAADSDVTCAACSFSNDARATLCIACANVLDPSVTWNHWRCQSQSCKDGVYVNPGDYGLCQVCGARKPSDS